jgi:hypothetical protein
VKLDFSLPWRIAPSGWTTRDVHACTSRITVAHTRCGYICSESWEFHDPLDYLDGYTLRGKLDECWQALIERRRLRRIVRTHTAAHHCAEDPWAHYGADYNEDGFEDAADDEAEYDPWVNYQTEDDADAEAEAEAMAWLAAGTECPRCTGDAAPTGRAVERADATEADLIEYRCGSCWGYFVQERA